MSSCACGIYRCHKEHNTCCLCCQFLLEITVKAAAVMPAAVKLAVACYKLHPMQLSESNGAVTFFVISVADAW